MLICAHRGDINPVDGFPENSLEAVRLAAERGVEAIEFDVQRTTDGVWYLLHDETLTRTTNLSGDINDLTSAFVDSAVMDGGGTFNAARHVGIKVPRLDDVVAELADYSGLVWFDNKDSPTADHTVLAQYVLANRPTNSVILCRSTSGAAAVKAVSSSLTTAILNSTSGAGNAAVDLHLAEVAYLDNAGFVSSQPKPLWTYTEVSNHYRKDESEEIKLALDSGCVGFMGCHAPLNLMTRDWLTGV